MEKGTQEYFPEYVATGFVSEYYGVSSTTVLQWIKNGLLPAFVLSSGNYRIQRDDFKTFLNKSRVLVRTGMH